MRLVVTLQARKDLQEIEEYIGRDNPTAAVNFVQRLTERFFDLAESPRIGRLRDDLEPGLRSSSVGDYLIFYTVGADKGIIVHVLHGARDLPRLFER